MDDPANAVKWYTQALKLGEEPILYFKIANQLKKLEEYDKAIAILNTLKQKSGNSAQLQRELSILNQAKNRIENPDTNVILKNIPLNTQFSEFASDYYRKDYLVISSDRKNSSAIKYGWTGRYFYDIFIVDKFSYEQMEEFNPAINKKYNDAAACFSPDNKNIYFVRCSADRDINNCMLYTSSFKNGNWTEPVLLPFVKEGFNYASPYIDNSGKILFFSLSKDSEEENYDIFYSIKSKTGWTKPAPLPSYINTPGNEKFISGWNNEIYFSSDFLPGLGGYDIFKTEIDSNGKFSPPEYLDYPFNSGGDDFYLLKDSDSTGVLSSSRSGGQGSDDIYSFIIKKPYLKTTPEDTTKIVSKEPVLHKKVFIAIKIRENAYAVKDDPNSKILGKKIVPDVILSFGNGEKIKVDNGRYIKEVKFDSVYHLVAGKNGYLSRSIDVKINPQSAFNKEINTININIDLDKIYMGKEIILKDIYYDYDKWNIRDDAKPTLDKLFNILKNNPQFRIRIGSHTDCRGENDYNMELSQKRAQSVVDYLVAKGIDKNRLIAQGFGKEKLIEKCPCEECTEIQHQKNRRTTFELLK
ncbi:MAG TPA: OmpA family protein [Saprospiraceae bacterium]|nr:OmpA family protein [Saprospiraceae bacterium]